MPALTLGPGSFRTHEILGISGWQCPGEISVAIPLPPDSFFVFPLLGRGLEEPGDGVCLPRSFLEPHTSCDFYFRTHRGQSQSLPAGMVRRVPGVAGFPSLPGPTNQEARALNPPSTGVDINSSAESQGAALYRIPSEPQMERNTASHSSFWALPASPFSHHSTNEGAGLTIKYGSNLKLACGGGPSANPARLTRLLFTLGGPGLPPRPGLMPALKTGS